MSSPDKSRKGRHHQKPVDPQQSAQSRTLWESYKVLPARTRLYISMAVCTAGAVGMFASDYLEKKFPVDRSAHV